jgi:hypothetical protein
MVFISKKTLTLLPLYELANPRSAHSLFGYSLDCCPEGQIKPVHSSPASLSEASWGARRLDMNFAEFVFGQTFTVLKQLFRAQQLPGMHARPEPQSELLEQGSLQLLLVMQTISPSRPIAQAFATPFTVMTRYVRHVPPLLQAPSLGAATVLTEVTVVV